MMLLWIFLALAALLIILGFVLPDHRRVERSIGIAAPPEQIFPHVADFHQWQHWSPWAGRDPDMDMTIEGEGVGQVMRWTSEKPNVGSGRQEVIEQESPRRLVTRLDFGGRGGGVAAFDIESAGDGQSRVRWSMETNMREGVPVTMKPMATYLGFFMDKMVGKDYEQGLASLKRVAENSQQ